jgi:hypothetical protein
MNDEVEDFLAHYGVKGMRWGVRNDKRGSGRVGLTTDQAVLATYGAVFATALLAKVVVDYKDSGRKDARKHGDKEFKKDPSLKRKMTPDELHTKVVKQINPKYGETGTKMNCRRCTMAYEMRRRGYDVKATYSRYAGDQGQRNFKKATLSKKETFQTDLGQKDVGPIAHLSSADRSKAIFSAIEKNPNGSRGEVTAAWFFGGAHSMAWEVVDRKAVIFDAQSGKKYANPSDFDMFAGGVSSASTTRLDNKQLNQEFLRRWVSDV